MRSSQQRFNGTRRRGAGLLLAAVGLTVLTAGLVPLRTELALASIVLLYLVVVVATAVAAGLIASLAAAIASDLLVNFFFVPPYHTLSVENEDHVITLVVYIAVAVTVSLAMDLAARQRASAVRSGIEAELLARISTQPVAAGSTRALLEHIRDTLHMDSAALVEGDTQVIAVAAAAPPGPQILSVPAGDGLTLVATGPATIASNTRFIAQLAAATARVLQAERLAGQAAHARELAEIDRLRAALLAAVGHDLRTPLAGIKAGVSSLRDPELNLDHPQRDELLATVEESADRMNDLVENLLAMSRLQAGALSVHNRPVSLGEVVAAALLHQPDPARTQVDVPDDLPFAYADPGLLERVIANLVLNARRASPPGHDIRILGSCTDHGLCLAVIDHGPGIPERHRDRVFQPFQRMDDRTTGTGPGLGLAIAKGFTEAMNGTVTATDTPGGGLTMTITLPAAP